MGEKNKQKGRGSEGAVVLGWYLPTVSLILAFKETIMWLHVGLLSGCIT
jgi:hypothetical protein